MIEKERKFLPKEGIDLIVYTDNYVTHKIEQGYLMLESDKQLRVRIIDKSRGFLAFKIGGGVQRTEFEYEIPLDDAKEMMSHTNTKLNKIRHSFDLTGIKIDYDIYPDGLEVIELEYQDDLSDDQIPYFCGVEISNLKEYSNIEIAKRNRYD